MDVVIVHLHLLTIVLNKFVPFSHTREKHTAEEMASLEDLEKEEARQQQEKRRNADATERAKRILEEIAQKKLVIVLPYRQGNVIVLHRAM